MPLPSSTIVQNQTNPRAACQLERTGTAQHHRPNVTRAALTTRKPRERSLLTRLLTKRAGAKTSYNLVAYSSIECAPCARIQFDDPQGLRRGWHPAWNGVLGMV